MLLHLMVVQSLQLKRYFMKRSLKPQPYVLVANFNFKLVTSVTKDN